MLAFVPLDPADLRRWATGSPPEGATRAFAATPAFLAAFALAAPDDEDAERTLLHVAALDALMRFGGRLVAVVDADAGGLVRDLADDLGTVELASPPFGRVTALFADHPDAAGAVADAAAALGASDLDAAWDDPVHVDLMETTDLLWFGPEEWARLA